MYVIGLLCCRTPVSSQASRPVPPGEMNAEQLKETTLDHQTRTLLKVDIESAVEADAIFSQLLGKDPAERHQLILEQASEADDLDV